ncbi:homoserine O-acetyltransferase MetX [Kocuria sp. HSID16901]|uniref:homoserine O-acetyltransferase MetX n=1 Tax=Kocuria sp. HSID16901 TaxID=2419505 RepID=UPI00066175ED|nr:homoserine O-acetyltransferase [Kocuria sp. HSID16901]
MTIAGTRPDQAALWDEGVARCFGIGDLRLESGAVIPDAELFFETWGVLNDDASNAVLVLHALTGDTHAARGQASESTPELQRLAAAQEGWWEGLIGPGAAIDTNRYFVVCPNILGGCYGSTGPASPAPASVDPDREPWGSRFPLVTIRDSVKAEAVLADALGIERFSLVIGGSMGGARAMEWAVTFPERVGHCAVIACGPEATAEQLSWGQAQSLAIRQDPDFSGGDYYAGPGPVHGLGLARRIAHITYRSASELHERFGRFPQDDEDPTGPCVNRRGRYRVESYLDHHASKLAGRFDANSYLVVNDALMSHDISRGRGTLQEALARSTCGWSVIAVDSDRLFYPRESESLAVALPRSVPVHTVSSPSGHDGFLIETAQIANCLAAGWPSAEAARR